MFVDKVKIIVKAGDGGNGAISFRHEKFVDRGGPDGGDGGNGGDVILQATRNQHTLAAFRHNKQLGAESGNSGTKRKKHGKSGKNLIVDVPVGTVAQNEDGVVLADLTQDGQQVIVAYGGHGGFGNAHFVSSRRQAPRIAEKGELGDKLDLTLELKTIAEVGLVGLPNAGKSTLLASVSNARPEIADYPFTTLKPNLGTVDLDNETSLVFADIPGLIEGASEGKGLGDAFLRHVERTSIILHLIDAYEDIGASYATVQKELQAYAIDLSKRPQIVVLNKIEGLSKQELAAKLKELKSIVKARTPVTAISAKTKQGVPELLVKIKTMVLKQRSKVEKATKPEIPVLRLENEDTWSVEKLDGSYQITGKRIERFAARTDFDNQAGIQRLRDIIRKMGIAHELERKGVERGQTIQIGNHKLVW